MGGLADIKVMKYLAVWVVLGALLYALLAWQQGKELNAVPPGEQSVQSSMELDQQMVELSAAAARRFNSERYDADRRAADVELHHDWERSSDLRRHRLERRDNFYWQAKVALLVAFVAAGYAVWQVQGGAKRSAG